MTTSQITTARLNGVNSICQFAVLEYLQDRTGLITTSEVARHLGTSKANITGVLDVLQRSRLIARSHSTTDRRVIHLRLTTAGQALAEYITAATTPALV